MKHITILVAILLVTTNTLVAQADKILGYWEIESNNAKIVIYKQNNEYYGKTVWSSKMYEADGKTSKKDVNNPDPKLRSRPTKNLVLLTNLKYKDGAWKDGKIYDPDSGKTYDCTVDIKNNILEIRGYIGIALVGYTVKWHRYK